MNAEENPETTGDTIPSYGDLLESIKELSSALDQMVDQLFKLELEIADIAMQSAFMFDPNIVEFVLNGQELEGEKREML